MTRRPTLAGWMLIAMVLGAAFGALAPPGAAQHLAIVPKIFLRLIQAVIAPVLLGVLISAGAGAGSAREFGRLALRAAIYFELMTAAALLTGWGAVWLVQPGRAFHFANSGGAAAVPQIPSAADVVTNAVPSSLFDALARGDILQIVIFTALFGAACAAAGVKAGPVTAFAGALTSVAFEFTRLIMCAAPLAVFASMAVTVAGNGSTALGGLAQFVITAWAAQSAFAIVAFGLSLRMAGIPLPAFTRAVREPFLVGFATTSSAAALPQTLESMSRLGISPRVVGIVTPLSLTLNLTGSCIHLAMGALFAAQGAGMHLSAGQQLAILATLKLTSKGVAGIPRANLVILAGLFAMFGLPAETLPMLLGIDALIDPVRTSVNVLGHAVAAPVMARFHNEPARAS